MSKQDLYPSQSHKGCWDQLSSLQGVAQGSSRRNRSRNQSSKGCPPLKHPLEATGFSEGLGKSAASKTVSKWSGCPLSSWFQRSIHLLETAQILLWPVPRRRDAFAGIVYRAKGFVYNAHQQPNYSSAFPLERASSTPDMINYIHAPFTDTNPQISLPLPPCQDYQRLWIAKLYPLPKVTGAPSVLLGISYIPAHHKLSFYSLFCTPAVCFGSSLHIQTLLDKGDYVYEISRGDLLLCLHLMEIKIPCSAHLHNDSLGLSPDRKLQV